MKKLALIILVAILYGCKGEAISTDQNGDFKVELLFEKDGCKMYRFYDGGRAIYWSNCSGNTQYTYSRKTNNVTTTGRVESSTVVASKSYVNP